MRPFSRDLRERVLADHQAGMNFADLGRKYTTSAEWVRQFIRRHERTGEIEARPPRVKKQPFHKRHEPEIRQAIAENPSHTLESLRTKLGTDVSIPTLWQALRKLKISFKKKRWSPPSRIAPTSPRNDGSLRTGDCRLLPIASCSSMKPG